MVQSSDLFQRYQGNPVLTAAHWPYPANTVFNPAATLLESGETLLLARVESHTGRSHLTVARSQDGFTDWRIDPSPTFFADPVHHPEETWGVEDPRITWLADRQEYAITYTAYSDRGPLVALATTKDFQEFTRHGPITVPENKDAAIFSEKIGGKYAMIHRPVPGMTSGAHMWISSSPDLLHWGEHRILMRARGGCWWDSGKVGLNNPPILTEAGWLVVYHGVRTTGAGCLYRLGLALLDRDDPEKTLHRTRGWVMGPKARYEIEGDVGYVVFPCGATVVEGQLRLYYGGADSCVAIATARLDDVLSFLEDQPEGA